MTESLPTPCLLVDVDRLDANIARMTTTSVRAGLALRPHAKTHKSSEIARRQLTSGASGLTVATVAEAEVFAAGGVEDLFLAYPVFASPEIGRRLRGLSGQTRLAVGIDNPESARALAAQLGSERDQVEVVVEVDSGQHRSGVAPDQAGVLAEQAAHSGLRVRGVFTFPGHGYSPDGRQHAADDERAALGTAAAAMRARGIDPRVVSGGSTPTADLMTGDPLTEMRPGVYVFGDAQQWELGTCSPGDVALTCLATVVSHAGGNVVLDSGSKALGADRPAWATGHGRLLDHPGARIHHLSEHHAVATWSDEHLPEIGSKVRVVPNHVCAAVNLASHLVAVSSGTVVDMWPVSARGANT